jgi:hypothetical protein
VFGTTPTALLLSLSVVVSLRLRVLVERKDRIEIQLQMRKSLQGHPGVMASGLWLAGPYRWDATASRPWSVTRGVLRNWGQ